MSVASGASEIAVVGIGTLFADSPTNESFWRHIVRGDDLITEVPPTHWSLRDYYDPDPGKPDKTYAKRGSFLPDIDFNPMEFGIPPANLSSTDTAQLLALVVAKRVLEDAVQGRFETLDRDRVSVILGVASATELVGEMSGRLQRPVIEHALRDFGMAEPEVQTICDAVTDSYVAWNESTFPGLLGNVVAGRIANRLDLRGTNTVLDAACASSLSAISMAVMELQLGHSDLVLSGGVDALNDIFMYMCFSKTPALSATGDCRPFSSQADGTLLGEGVGIFALRRLADAERDGDRIYAVIKGIGSSSDGQSKSVYAPSASGQARALAAAYRRAGYGPETVELVEAHGTGTRAGDLAEFEGLRSIFSPSREDAQWCALGSIKSQIGHTKGAAGSAGFFKAVMALHHKVLPPTINIEQPNPAFEIESSPFYLNIKARPWFRDHHHPRRASVSAFGFGGSNFHLTVEEYTGEHQPPRTPVFPSHLFVWSAASKEKLVELCSPLPAELEDGYSFDLLGLSRETQRSARSGQPHRIAIVAEDLPTLKNRIAEALEALTDRTDASCIDGNGFCYGGEQDPGKVAFLFPGQGSQYVDMGAEVAMAFPAVRRVWDEHGSRAGGGTALHRVVFPPPAFDDRAAQRHAEFLRQTEWAQPAIGVSSLSYLKILSGLGVVPDCVGGHSFGELTALHAAGVLSEADFLSAAFTRGTLMAEAAREPGAMTAVFGAASEVERLCREDGAGVGVANYNSPTQCVVSGSLPAIENFESRLTTESIRFQRLAVGTAFHSAIVAPAVDPFAERLADLTLQRPRIPVFANSTAQPYDSNPEKARRLLAEQIAKPVRFEQELQAMYDFGVRTFIEVGPGSVLTGLARQSLPDDASVVPLDRKGKDGIATLWAALADLWTRGNSLDFGWLWDGYEVPDARQEKDSPPGSVRINGSNYGRPYPKNLPTVIGVEGIEETPFQREAQDMAPPQHPAQHSPAWSREATPGSSGDEKVKSMHKDDSPPKHDLNQASLLQTFEELQRQTAQAHAAFQQSMAQSHSEFLAASEKTFLAFARLLSGQAPDPAVPPTFQSPDSTTGEEAPYSVSSASVDPVGQNGHGGRSSDASFMPPAPELGPVPTADPSAADSSVTASWSSGEPVSEPPSRRDTPPAEPAPANGGARHNVEELMLSVMAEKTGYPPEMLKRNLDLESDLGIDSIKRVEILSAMKDNLKESVEVDPQQMAGLRTIGEVVDYLDQQVKKN